jgi:hypothetical protein
MAVGNDDKRRVAVLAVSLLLAASGIVGANSVDGANGIGGGASSSATGSNGVAVSASESVAEADTGSATTIETTTTTDESPGSLEPRFDFACEQVAVTARGYDSVTLVFEGGDRQTFRWSFRGRNVFFGTGERVGATVAAVVVRRDGEEVTRRNPSFEACVGSTGTAATVTSAVSATPSGTAPTATTTTVPATAPTVTATPNTAPTTANVTTTTTAGSGATLTVETLDLTPFGELTATPTTPAGTTVRGTANATATIPTPTVTPRPIAGFPECSDEELGLSAVLNLTDENGSFASEDAIEVEEDRFRFTVEGETYELELVEVERNDAGRPVSVAFDSEIPIDAVIVRTGQGANVYEFPGGVSRRAGLRAPTDANRAPTDAESGTRPTRPPSVPPPKAGVTAVATTNIEYRIEWRQYRAEIEYFCMNKIKIEIHTI